MEIRTRHLNSEQVKNLDIIASENDISRDKLVAKIITEYLEGKNFLKAHRTFFDEEVSKIIPIIENNNQIIERALIYLEKE